MGALPADLPGVALVVLLLGMRHGFDADHLAAIDGLARHNAAARPALARRCGALFSLGHGLVVVAVALAVSAAAEAWQPPGWFAALGTWVSATVLVLLGAANLAAVVRTPAEAATRLAGWRSGVFSALLRAEHPAAVMAVGTLFALSFDTLSQAALFAATAGAFGGWPSALLLGGLFTAGMLLTDGASGWWIARLVRRSDATARVASRVMALAVAGISLLTAAFALATLYVPAVDAWAETRGAWFGAGIVAVVATSFLVGQRLARGPRRTAPDAG